MEQKNNLELILKKGIELKSSGTTGPQKKIYQSPYKLKQANKIARECQQISSKSKIYTVCKLEHAGGLLAQTLPGYEVGAHIKIEKFNAYNFCKKIKNFTHSHITPKHGKAIMMTKSFQTLNLDWELITNFVKKGCKFMVNWGMTEIGPCAINTLFKNIEEVEEYKKRALKGALMGNNVYCDTKIEKGTLHVKGDISVFGNNWFDTRDRVKKNETNEFYIQGRLI